MTAIMTLMGLVRIVTILQGGANSVAQCQRVMQFVLADAYGKAVQAFLDDFGIKGPKTTYNDEMAFSGVRRYNLDETLYLLELAGMVISAEKSQFTISGVAVVSWVCDKDGRRLDEVKVARLVFWPVPTSVPEVRLFVGLVVYFRVVVEKFGVIIAPLYLLLKAGADFKWEDNQQLAFDEIKRILSTFLCVLPIDYD
ncbi:gag-pol polyprotein [Penicillium longicatenatum]|uniref:gag-pol polyprotein n=1 Tax=Penicillium longicatenatum TaxID=1561947 RepID=UPI00254921A1|nr:gag-pol polyprotein [Penicillium longicatenatum]KAJ5636943.1 gag-pol polyprotein [Penicillium longicatenatum]